MLGLFLIASLFLFDEETSIYVQTQPIARDASKEFRDPYFQSLFYIDDLGEEGDTVKSTIKSGFSYEGNLGVIIDELARPGSIAVDLGAHIGVHTLTLSKKIGPLGKVYSFEPNRKLYSELVQNIKINACQNVIPICKAVGEKEKQAFYKWGWIDDERPYGAGYLVPVVPLDTYSLKNVSLIKMDVENYEYLILQGAAQTIRESKPVIIFECYLECSFETVSSEQQRENFEKVISLIESYGYEIYIIHCCNFIAFPLNSYPLSIYKSKFQKLDRKTYNPHTPSADSIDYRK